MVGVFNIDRQSGERHVTGDGFLVDLHRDLAEGHGHRIILRQLEAQVHAALGVAHHRLIAHVLQQQLFSFFVFFHNIKRAGVAAGDLAALGQDHLQQFAGIVLRAERGPNLVELIDLAGGEGQPGVHLLAAGYQVNVVQRVVNHALNQRNRRARNQVSIDQPVEAVIFEPGLAEAKDADVGRVQVREWLCIRCCKRLLRIHVAAGGVKRQLVGQGKIDVPVSGLCQFREFRRFGVRHDRCQRLPQLVRHRRGDLAHRGDA